MLVLIIYCCLLPDKQMYRWAKELQKIDSPIINKKHNVPKYNLEQNFSKTL